MAILPLISGKVVPASSVAPTVASERPTSLPLLGRLATVTPSRGSEFHTGLEGLGMRCNIRSSHIFLGGASSPKMPRRCSAARPPHLHGGLYALRPPPHEGFAFIAAAPLM